MCKYLLKEKNPVISRGVFKTLSNIYDEVFCENSSWLFAIKYFRKTNSLRDSSQGP